MLKVGWSLQLVEKCRGGICPSRHCRRQCKIFASGVNFSIFTHFFVFFLTKTVEIRWNWWCKIFSLKIRRCKILDKFHVCCHYPLYLLTPRGIFYCMGMASLRDPNVLKGNVAFIETWDNHWPRQWISSIEYIVAKLFRRPWNVGRVENAWPSIIILTKKMSISVTVLIVWKMSPKKWTYL